MLVTLDDSPMAHYTLPRKVTTYLAAGRPVLAALSGIIFLGEQLNVAQWVALACIIVASIGATLTIRRKS